MLGQQPQHKYFDVDIQNWLNLLLQNIQAALEADGGLSYIKSVWTCIFLQDTSVSTQQTLSVLISQVVLYFSAHLVWLNKLILE